MQPTAEAGVYLDTYNEYKLASHAAIKQQNALKMISGSLAIAWFVKIFIMRTTLTWHKDTNRNVVKVIST